MKERLLYLYCRVRTGAVNLSKRIGLRETLTGEAGLSKLAVTVILVGVGVALALAVVAILGPRIISLAERTGSQIDSVPMDWGQ